MSPSGCAHFRDDVNRPRLDDALRLRRESWPRLQRESALPSERASVLRLPPDAGRSPLRDGELRLQPDAGRRARPAFARLQQTCDGRLRAPAPGRSRPRRREISSRHAGAIHLPARASGPRLPKGDAVLRRRPALAPLPHVVAFPVPRGALLRQRAAELQRQRGAHLPWPACASLLLRRSLVPAPRSAADSLPRPVRALRRRFSVSRVPHADVNFRLPPGSDAHARIATHFQPAVSLPRTPPGGFALPLSNESARLPTALSHRWPCLPG